MGAGRLADVGRGSLCEVGRWHLSLDLTTLALSLTGKAPFSDFPQIFLNSFSPESGVTKRLDSYLELYHAALCAKQPAAAESYSLAELQADFRLALVDMWFQVRAPLDWPRGLALSLTRRPFPCAVHRVHDVVLPIVP